MYEDVEKYGTLVYCCWDWTNGPVAMETVWWLFTKVNIELPYDFAILPLDNAENWKQVLKQPRIHTGYSQQHYFQKVEIA